MRSGKIEEPAARGSFGRTSCLAGRRLALVFAYCMLGAAETSVAAADDFDRACIEPAVTALEARGASRSGPVRVGFLRAQESQSFPFTLPSSGCFGFLAVGHRRVQDLDILLHTRSGILVAQDLAVDAHPYVRFCGAAALELTVSVRMFKGQGEFRLVGLAAAPSQLPDFNRVVGQCFASEEGIGEPIAEVGPEPRGPMLDETIARLSAEFVEHGYRPLGREERGAARQGQSTSWSLELEANRCYAVLGVGATGVFDFDLQVRGPDGRVEARDVDRARDAKARFCASLSGRHTVEAQMYEGSGAWALTAFVLEETPPAERPRHLDGAGRIAYAEAAHTMRNAGLGPADGMTHWGMLNPGERLTVPVRLEAGRCYAFAGVPTGELASADLDLKLVDDLGVLVAWDVGRSPTPLVHTCPHETATYRILSEVHGARGRFLVLGGIDRREGTKTDGSTQAP